MNVYLYVHGNPINHIDPLGLAPSTLESVTLDLETGEQSAVYERDVDARYKNYNVPMRYSTPAVPDAPPLMENPGRELRQIVDADFSAGVYLTVKPKVQVGPLKVQLGAGYERGTGVAYTGGQVEENTVEGFSASVGIKKGNAMVFGGEYTYGRSAEGVPDPEYLGPYYREEYNECNIPVVVETYEAESIGHYLERTGAEWDSKWQWQLAPGVGGKSDNLMVQGQGSDWKLQVGGTLPFIKGHVGVNLTEMVDFGQKMLGGDGIGK